MGDPQWSPWVSRALHPAMCATSTASSTEALPVAVLRATWLDQKMGKSMDIWDHQILIVVGIYTFLAG